MSRKRKMSTAEKHRRRERRQARRRDRVKRRPPQELERREKQAIATIIEGEQQLRRFLEPLVKVSRAREKADAKVTTKRRRGVKANLKRRGVIA